jgi:site-specific DNA-methyltransferase (adenine-specific)
MTTTNTGEAAPEAGRRFAEPAAHEPSLQAVSALTGGHQAQVEVIGNATLYLGDARKILPTLGKVDHIITDPPYSARTHAGHDVIAAHARPDGSERASLGYAALSESDVVELSAQFAGICDGWIVWMTDHTLAPVIDRSLKSGGRYVFAPLPFFQAGRSVRMAGDGPSSWTDWIVVSRTALQIKWGTLRGGYIAGTGWDDKARMGGKPTRLMQMIVTDYSRPDDLVCDPFMGAGTTGVACWREGRRFVGIEIDPQAFAIACKRIEDAQRQGSLFGEAAA